MHWTMTFHAPNPRISAHLKRTPETVPAFFASERLCAIVLALGTCLGGGLVRTQSFYPQRPDDPRAVDFTKEAFGPHADGVGDDAEALQQAVNRAQETRAGLVLIPEGRYRLGKTVHVWQGIRLLGYGPKRPVFLLGRNTPGFQQGTGHYLIHFADNRPRGDGPIVDASEFTFYSGMGNIDFELQEGNLTAIAIRFHVAQGIAGAGIRVHALPFVVLFVSDEEPIFPPSIMVRVSSRALGSEFVQRVVDFLPRFINVASL